MTRERERTRDRGERIENSAEIRNTIEIENSEEARDRLVSRVESDEPIVDIDSSDSFEFAQKLRNRFKNYL